MENKISSPAAKGILIALILIVLSLTLQLLDLSQNKSIGSLLFVILVFGLIWAARTYAAQNNANVTFGNVFAHCFKTNAAVTALMIVFTLISIKFISPEQVTIAMDEARANLEDRNMSDEQIDQALEITKKFFLPLTIGGILLIYIVVGVVGSLIGAAVVKKNPADPFTQNG